MHYSDLVRGMSTSRPTADAVVGSGRRLSFADVDERANRLCDALRTRGVRPGDRVALLAGNEPEYVEIQAACLRAGFALVPLNIRLTQPELLFILSDCTPSVIIGGRGLEERSAVLAGLAGIAHHFALGSSPAEMNYEDALAHASSTRGEEPDDAELIATILYTSGTTGQPKGALVTRRAFTARVLVNAAELQTTTADTHLACLPLFHIAAFLTYAHIAVGATVVMLPEFDPLAFVDVVRAEQVTTTVLVPTMIGMIVDEPALAQTDLTGMRLIIYGGAPIHADLLRRSLARFQCGFHQQYGMTETGAQTILRPADHDPDDLEKLSSGGTEAISFEVRVVDADDTPVPDGSPGEVVCQSPTVMSGYWNRPEATAETLRGGWMHTGDVGFRDSRGYLHITDRRNDMIISGGENVYPREVESVLLEHPHVRDVAVVGTSDPTWGEVVTAVVLAPAPPTEELATFLRERLAGYKVPRRWVVEDELPRNATGKLLKHVIRAGLEASDAD
ncbi:MAG: long-chain-fatty-acid--CoA ligase [Nostocoides sp.]